MDAGGAGVMDLGHREERGRQAGRFRFPSPEHRSGRIREEWGPGIFGGRKVGRGASSQSCDPAVRSLRTSEPGGDPEAAGSRLISGSQGTEDGILTPDLGWTKDKRY